ncbi:hypothetical protein FEF65_04795 [Mariprofundus erugo]|uniref:Uncharacterized protein n=1 Tax=Mariprofundus erugo TaxID=2528639 RepID=A0A5R9GWM7_9PROT|nr:hypothetical protein [Mariprofundus erugo]TLS68312.1 hypothetical protein FEF65_04795 [Mariprofundus erugo]
MKTNTLFTGVLAVMFAVSFAASSALAEGDSNYSSYNTSSKDSSSSTTSSSETKDSSSSGNDKATICHNGHSITISTSAVSAHMAHGDQMGTCVPMSCQCAAAATAADNAGKADSAYSAAQHSKSTADDNYAKADKAYNDALQTKDSKDDQEAKNARDAAYAEASKADSEFNSARDNKTTADKYQADVTTAVSGAPCTCSDGSSGFWGDASTGTPVTPGGMGATAPEALREIYGN